MVYVISKDGKTLMPTKRHGKVRRLLKQELAKVVRREPLEKAKTLMLERREQHILHLAEDEGECAEC